MNAIKQLRILAWIEGFTYLAFGLTMPLKYIFELKEPNYYVGMLHGVFFIAYIVWVLGVGFNYNFSIKNIFLMCFASLFPFGTFWVDHAFLKKKAQ